MKTDLPLGRIAGIRIGLNWSVLLIAGVYVLALAGSEFPNAYPGLGTAVYWLAGLVGAGLFFASLLAHELAHAVMARRERIEVEGVTLWLLGGFTRLTSEPSTPGAQFRIAAAGPVSNGALALAFWVVHLLLGGSAAIDSGQGVGSLAAGVAGWLAVINGLLALLNLLPAAPLDGGQILTAGLWAARRDRTQATAWSAVAGMGLGGLLIGIGVIGLGGSGSLQPVWLIIVGWWILGTARSQYAMASADAVFARTTLGQVMLADPPLVPEWATVDAVAANLPPGTRHRAFPVQAADGRITGLLTVEQMAALDPWHRSNMPVSQLAFPLNRLTWASTADPVLPSVHRLADSGVPAMLVLWPDQRLAGIVGEPELQAAFQQGRARGPRIGAGR